MVVTRFAVPKFVATHSHRQACHRQREGAIYLVQNSAADVPPEPRQGVC